MSLVPSTSAAVAADTDVVLSGGPHYAERDSDGTTTLSLTAINLTKQEIALRLVTAGGDCAESNGEAVVQPQSSSTVTFTTTCNSGKQLRTGTVQVAYAHGAGTPPTSELPIQFTVTPRSPAEWSVLWWFGLGFPLALFLVLVPYQFWVAHPRGNKEKSPKDVNSEEQTSEEQTSQEQTSAEKSADQERDVRVISSQAFKRTWTRLRDALPGLENDWSWDSWSSNATLGAGLFTAVLASTGPATAILGEEATAPLRSSPSPRPSLWPRR